MKVTKLVRLFSAAANQNAAKSVVSTASSNPTILNLLNSAPAAMTHVTSSTENSIDAHKLLGRVSLAGARLIAATTASHTIPTYTQQVSLYWFGRN